MRVDKALVLAARQANLAEYLKSKGEPLTKLGNRHRHAKNSSLVFTKNAYYWNSRNEHGNALDYLIRHMGMGFLEAVTELTNLKPSNHLLECHVSESSKAFPKDDSNRRVIAYLCKTRHVNFGIVKSLISSNHLHQDAVHGNAVFSIYNEHGERVGAEVCGTLTGVRFKGMEPGSPKGYGFNVRFSPDNQFKYVLFFESAIDLLSFIDIKRNLQGKSLERCILISLAGLREDIFMHSLALYKGNVVLCVDNDHAGDEFIRRANAMEVSLSVHRPESSFKDWNELLKNSRNP